MNIPTLIALGVIAASIVCLAVLMAHRGAFVRTAIRLDTNKTYRLGDRLWGELRIVARRDVRMGPVVLVLTCRADRQGADASVHPETIYETRLVLEDELSLVEGEQFTQVFNFDLPQLDELAIQSPARPLDLGARFGLDDVYNHLASDGSFSLETPADSHPVAQYLAGLFDKKRRSACHWQVRVSTGVQNGPEIAGESRLSVRGFGHLYRLNA